MTKQIAVLVGSNSTTSVSQIVACYLQSIAPAPLSTCQPHLLQQT